MKKLYRLFFTDIALKWKLTIIYTLFISLLIFGIGYFSYVNTIRILEEKEMSLLRSGLVLKGEAVNTFLDMVQRKVDLLFNNRLLQKVLQADYSENHMLDVVLAYEEVINPTVNPVFEDLTSMNYSFTGQSGTALRIIIYPFNDTLSVDGNTLREYMSIRTEPWVTRLLNSVSAPYWRSGVEEKGILYLSVNRVMKDFSTREAIGIIAILIPEENISAMLKNQSVDLNQFFLVMSGGAIGPVAGFEPKLGNLTYTENEDDLRIASLAGEKVIYGSYPVMVNNWRLFGFSPYSELIRRLRTMRVTFFIFFLTGVIISELLIFLISQKLSSRLELINQKFSIIRKDRRALMAPIGGEDEIGRLDINFHRMIEELNLLVDKEKAWDFEKNFLTLELLQAQINPHLLYNTLATIEWKAKKEETEEIRDIARKLIAFFRYYLNNGALMAPVSEEVSMIKEYAEIFLYTYQLDCETQIEIKPEIEPYYSIKLFLQPVVENALQHGIRPVNKIRKGRLEIYGCKEGQSLVFTVKDNGLGMSEETIEKIKRGEVFSKHGFGISNVRRRIALYFGDEFGISFISKENKGTEVIIRIPALEEEDMKEIISY